MSQQFCRQYLYIINGAALAEIIYQDTGILSFSQKGQVIGRACKLTLETRREDSWRGDGGGA